MQRLRLSASLPETLQHPVQHLERRRVAMERKRMLYWNLFDDDHVQFLFHVEGDREAFEGILTAATPVVDHETVPIGVGSFYALTTERRTEVVERLGAVLAAADVVPLPPVEFAGDGELEATFIGDPGSVRALLDNLPESVAFDVEQLTRHDRPVNAPGAGLTSRQREAVAAAVAVGYYAVPREGSVADVAKELGCAPSTASNHLRKAEASIMARIA